MDDASLFTYTLFDIESRDVLVATDDADVLRLVIAHATEANPNADGLSLTIVVDGGHATLVGPAVVRWFHIPERWFGGASG